MRRLPLLSLLVILHLRAVAQNAEQWSGVAFEHEVTKRFGYEFEVEYRRDFSRASDGRYYLLGAVNWQLTELLDLAVGGRYEPKRGKEVADSRLFSDLNASLPLGDGPLTLTGRLRYQYDFEPGAEVTGGNHRVRPRLGLSWEIAKGVSLVGEAERRYDLTIQRWIRRRLTVGPELAISDRIGLSAYYRNQLDFGNEPKNTSHIVGVYLSYVLPDGRDREWKYRRPFGRRILW